MIDLRLGSFVDVLADVIADAIICDPPFSLRTHGGAISSTGVVGVEEYEGWTETQAVEFARWCDAHAKGWIAIFNDDINGPVMRSALEVSGRRAFPLVPILQHMPNIRGDGPAPSGCFLIVARPRTAEAAACGSLPGWYEMPRDGSIVRGGKPLGGMRRIVRDYSRPGDLVMDCTAGGGTTLLACEIEERRSVGAEIDAQRCAIARARCTFDAGEMARLRAQPLKDSPNLDLFTTP